MSHAIARHFKLDDPRYKAKHTIIYDGLFCEKELQNKPAPEPANPYKFEFILTGALCKGKGQAEAIHALRIVVRSFPETHLHLVGDGDMRELKHLADNFGLSENITFWGYKKTCLNASRRLTPALCARATKASAALPLSIWQRGFPLSVIMEAQHPKSSKVGKRDFDFFTQEVANNSLTACSV